MRASRDSARNDWYVTGTLRYERGGHWYFEVQKLVQKLGRALLHKIMLETRGGDWEQTFPEF
eukprot:108160-Pleurochrysis_carterae.AAC.5